MVADSLADRFKETLLDPEAWKQTAYHLLSAAALLEPKIDEFWDRLRSGVSGSSSRRSWDDEFVAIHFMLCAYAIENLLKGKIIQKEVCGLRPNCSRAQFFQENSVNTISIGSL